MQANSPEITTPLLITSAVRPPEGVHYLHMTDPTQRLLSSKAFVLLWASGCRIRNLVICDATGERLLSEQEAQSLAQFGISVEQIAFHQNAEEVQRLGKGFGEGKIIECAVKNSKLIARAGAFYKCTAKIFIKNLLEIDQAIQRHGFKAFFYRQPLGGMEDFNYADTRFFYSTVDFFNQVVLAGYQNSKDVGGLIAEKAVFNALLPATKKGLFSRPDVFGLSGGTARFYPELTFGAFDKRFPCLVA